MNVYVGGLLLIGGALLVVAGVKSRGSQLFTVVMGTGVPAKGGSGGTAPAVATSPAPTAAKPSGGVWV